METENKNSSDDDIMIIEDQCMPPTSEQQNTPPQNKRRNKVTGLLSNYVSTCISIDPTFDFFEENFFCSENVQRTFRFLN